MTVTRRRWSSLEVELPQFLFLRFSIRCWGCFQSIQASSAGFCTLSLAMSHDLEMRSTHWDLSGLCPFLTLKFFGQAPAFRATWRKRRLVLQVLILDWYYLGRPAICPGQLWLGRSLTSRQWKRVKLLEHLSEDSNSLLSVDAEAMARAALKTEASSDQLDALHRALVSSTLAGAAPYSGATSSTTRAREKVDADVEAALPGLFGALEGSLKGEPFVVAKPIQADRIHFIGSPKFDPMPFFDPSTARAYAHPLQHAHDEPGEIPPKVSVHATAVERNKLFQKMADGGRLIPIRYEDETRGLFSGLFSVPKDLVKDRLILDARPPNTAEDILSSWTKTMSSASTLAGIELNDRESLIMSGRDVRDFFYQFRVSSERAHRNVLATRLEADDLEFIFRRPFSSGGYVGLNTMAMGDCSAVEFAQGSHVQMLLESGGATWQELIRMHSPYPRGDLSIGIVIDDLVCFEKVLTASLPKISEEGSKIDTRMKLIMKKYHEVHLPTNEKKAFDNCCSSSFWGVQVDGKKGLVRANESRTWPLVLITTRVVSLGLSTVGLLRSLAGSYISVFSLRRRMLSMMNFVFDAIAASSSDEDVVRLSDGLKDELMSMASLTTLAAINLRAVTQETLRATDASDWGMAAVSSPLPYNVAREAQRLSLSKSMWTKLLPPGKAWLRSKLLLRPEDELPGEHDQYDVHPFWEQLARSLNFKEEWRKQRKKSVHVNIGELRAHLLEESRLATNLVSARIAYALDSQVALGSLVKGRASSKPLNGELMKSIPIVLGSDLYAAYGYWPSKLNRADGPTRDSVPDPPDQDLPWWWNYVIAGGYTAFDGWLNSLQHDINRDARADVDGAGKPVLLKTGRNERTEEWLRSKKLRRPSAFVDADSKDDAKRTVTTLPAEAVSILESFSEQQVLLRKDVDGFYEPGVLDLYSGLGGIAKASIRCGAPWAVTFELSRSAEEDVLSPANKEKIRRLIVLGAVRCVGSALVCRSFSAAVTPPVRSPKFPRGVPWMSRAMREKVKEGNNMADFQAEVQSLCIVGVVPTFFWVENPDSSYLWQQRKFRTRYRQPDSAFLFRCDYCRFGTKWRKRTRFGTNVPKLMGLRMMCQCKGNHQPLRGQHPTLKKPWTLVAQPYPRGLCKLVGSAVADACGWSGKLDIGGCAKVGTLRIGEASQSVRAPRGYSLEEMPVQTWTSLHIGEKRWDFFLEWCRGFLSGDPLQLFLQVPLFLAHAIRRYGDNDFKTGGSLMYYRHLVLAAQRKVPTLKPYASICWDLASRWEKVEPTQHRPPIPEVLAQALAALAWSLGWRRWSCITMICFHGVARVGEVISCVRSDLLLPADMLYESSCAFVLLRHSKTMHRQAARLQHLKIESELVVKLLQKTFEHSSRDEQLFHGSPHVYRQRWDFLLKLLGVQKELRVTPGGLRGGGAVSWYRRGGSISDLLWAMRLKQISTLESYLQEVSAISLLTDLSYEARHAIRCAASLFRCLDHSVGLWQCVLAMCGSVLLSSTPTRPFLEW